MCVSFAVNKGVQQENVTVKKRQKGGIIPQKPKGGRKEVHRIQQNNVLHQRVNRVHQPPRHDPVL